VFHLAGDDMSSFRISGKGLNERPAFVAFGSTACENDFSGSAPRRPATCSRASVSLSGYLPPKEMGA